MVIPPEAVITRAAAIRSAAGTTLRGQPTTRRRRIALPKLTIPRPPFSTIRSQPTDPTRTAVGVVTDTTAGTTRGTGIATDTMTADTGIRDMVEGIAAAAVIE